MKYRIHGNGVFEAHDMKDALIILAGLFLAISLGKNMNPFEEGGIRIDPVPESKNAEG